MKKIIALILVLSMVLSFSACAKTETPAEEPDEKPTEEQSEEPAEATVGLPNPITEYNSIDELCEASGVIFAKPPVMGVSDEYFQSIEGDPTVYEYGFKVNGIEFDVRFADEFEPDICGVYEDGKTVFEGEAPGDAVKYFDDCKLYRFYLIFGQYVITAFDNGTYTEDQFVGICEEIRALMIPAEPNELDGFEGNYADETSQRATLLIERPSDDELFFTVSWAESAEATRVWTMTVTMDDEARLVYSDCKCVIKGTGEDETVYENGTGYFEFDADVLYWTGAADENCKDCKFVRTE